MDSVSILPPYTIGRGFVMPEHLPKGTDEYHIRNEQVRRPAEYWRRLLPAEVDALRRNGNRCDNWDLVLVTDEFEPDMIRGNEFFGLVRFGRVRRAVVAHHDLRLPTGVTGSRIVSCDLGADVAIHCVRYLAHYIVGERCILHNVDEMFCSGRAKFGCGIVKDGEDEHARTWMNVVNESGGRGILPCDGMTSADAYLWAAFRDDAALQRKLVEVTQRSFDARRGRYGTIGDQSVIVSTRIVKDTAIGAHCRVEGANALKNVTVNSSGDEPTQIGQGVELVNGIVGLGCRVCFGSKAVRFVLGNNVALKLGARLVDACVGDNSTVSCCEVVSSLLFPGHEQHHNNSFLIAALVMGQSNIAAGATLGSNHNSRAADGELLAGRGFWPGLCVSVKHSSRFASFTLLAKGDHPAELDVTLPFSLVSNNASRDRLEILPAYWWMHNMYALARNPSKLEARDHRMTKTQHVETDFLAPDTVEEILSARRLLELWTGRAYLRATSVKKAGAAQALRKGRELLSGPVEATAGLEVLGEGIERSDRLVVIRKPAQAWQAYGDMALHYAVKNLLSYMEGNPRATRASIVKAMGGERQTQWVNLGGQIVCQNDVNKLIADIKRGVLCTWKDIHRRHHAVWEAYPLSKRRHALAVLCEVLGAPRPTKEQWMVALHRAGRIQREIRDRVVLSRRKDFDNPFRQATFRNRAEMDAVIGTAEGSSFAKAVRRETESVLRSIEAAVKRG